METMSKKNIPGLEEALKDFEDLLKSGKGTREDVDLVALARGQLETAKKQQARVNLS